MQTRAIVPLSSVIMPVFASLSSVLPCIGRRAADQGASVTNAVSAEQKNAWGLDIKAFVEVLVRHHSALEACRYPLRGDGGIRRFDGAAISSEIEMAFVELEAHLGWVDGPPQEIGALLSAALRELNASDREAVEAWFSKFGGDLRKHLTAKVVVAPDALGLELRHALTAANVGKALNCVRDHVRRLETRALMSASGTFAPNRYRDNLAQFINYGVLSAGNNDAASLADRLRSLIASGPPDLDARSDDEDLAYHQALQDGIAMLSAQEIERLKQWFQSDGPKELLALTGKQGPRKSQPAALRELSHIQGYVNRIGDKVSAEFTARARTLENLAAKLEPLARMAGDNGPARASAADIHDLIQACRDAEHDYRDWAPLLSPLAWNEQDDQSHAHVMQQLVSRLRRLAEHHEWTGGNPARLARVADQLRFELGCMLPEARALWIESAGAPTAEARAQRLGRYVNRMGVAVATELADFRAAVNVRAQRLETLLADMSRRLTIQSKGRSTDRDKLDRLIGELRVLSDEVLITGTQPTELESLHDKLAIVIASTAHYISDTQLSCLAKCEGLGLPLDRMALDIRGMRQALDSLGKAESETDLLKGVVRYANHVEHLHGALSSMCRQRAPGSASGSLPSHEDLRQRSLELAVARLGRAQRARLGALLAGPHIVPAVQALRDLVQDGKVPVGGWRETHVLNDTVLRIERGLASAVSGWGTALSELVRFLGTSNTVKSDGAASDATALGEFLFNGLGIRIERKRDNSNALEVSYMKDVEINLQVNGDVRRATICGEHEIHEEGAPFLALMMDPTTLTQASVPYEVKEPDGTKRAITVNGQLLVDIERLDLRAGTVHLAQGAARNNMAAVAAFLRQLEEICTDQQKLWFFSGLLNQTVWALFYQNPPSMRYDWVLHGDSRMTLGQSVPTGGAAPAIRYNKDPLRCTSGLDRELTPAGSHVVLKSELETQLLGILPDLYAADHQMAGLDPQLSKWLCAFELRVPDQNRFDGSWQLGGVELWVNKRVVLAEKAYSPLATSTLPPFDTAEPDRAEVPHVAGPQGALHFFPHPVVDRA